VRTVCDAMFLGRFFTVLDQFTCFDGFAAGSIRTYCSILPDKSIPIGHTYVPAPSGKSFGNGRLVRMKYGDLAHRKQAGFSRAREGICRTRFRNSMIDTGFRICSDSHYEPAVKRVDTPWRYELDDSAAVPTVRREARGFYLPRRAPVGVGKDQEPRRALPAEVARHGITSLCAGRSAALANAVDRLARQHRTCRRSEAAHIAAPPGSASPQ
jgi:hypothetical protein